MFLTAHAAGMLFLAARRQWIHRLRPDSVQGSDLHMMRWCIDNQTRAYGFFSLSFGCDDDAAFQRVMDTMVADITQRLTDPRSHYRRGMDLDAQRYVWRSGLTIDDLVEVTDDDDRFFRIDDGAKREMVIRFHTGRRLLGFLFDHTVWDGIRVVNECVVPALECKPFDSKWLVEDNYTPGLSEAIMVYTGYRTGLRALTYRPLPTFDDGHKQHVVQHIWSVDEVKALKNELKVPFSAAIVAMYGRAVLSWLPDSRKRVRMGIIIGFKSQRFRNNYSIIAVDVFRKHDVRQSIRDVAGQLKRRKVEVMGLYHLVNTVEVETFFKSHLVDVLFSPAFFDRDAGLSLEVDDMRFYNVPCSTPMYSFACSIDDRISICTTLNCPDVDFDKMKEAAVSVFHYAPSGSLVDVTPAETAAR